jgi:purine-binding chemotaxis protein CheW
MDENKEKIIIEVDDRDFEQRQDKLNDFRALAFSLKNEKYAVCVDQIKEVVSVLGITRVPHAPEFVIGVMNLRGEIISVLDIRYFLGLEHKAPTLEEKLIIIEINSEYVGILVDKIEDTISFERDLIQPPLATLGEVLSRYTKGQI